MYSGQGGMRQGIGLSIGTIGREKKIANIIKVNKIFMLFGLEQSRQFIVDNWERLFL